MSTQEEAATKWGMFENYKKHESRYAAVASKVQGWGQEMARLSTIAGNPYALVGISVSKMPDKAELLEAQNELKKLNALISGLKELLRQAGMDHLK
jgi:hypothetical protein